MPTFIHKPPKKKGKNESNAVVTPLRKVATYEPRIKDKLGKSKRITGH